MTRRAFHFPLDALLKVRKAREQASQRELAQVQRERAAIEEAIAGRQHEIARARGDVKSALSGTLDMLMLRDFSRVAIGSTRAAQQLVTKLAGIVKREEQARAALLDAARERQAIELLRERRLDDWRQDERRRETRESDDLMTTLPRREAT